jgi:hypothetical protein
MGFLDALMNIGQELVSKAREGQYRNMERASRQCKSQCGREMTIGGKTLQEWEAGWQGRGSLADAELGGLSASVGLYRAKLSGRIVYVGRAVEYDNGGLRKRLSDYTRESDSGRRHASGKLMNANAGDLTIDVLITGGDENAAEAARRLEAYFIGKYQPEWNKMLK